MSKSFKLLYADTQGNFYDAPQLQALGRSGEFWVELRKEEMYPLPEGASLVLIPEGTPAGVNLQGEFSFLEKDAYGQKAWAVGALLPQGFTRTLFPAYQRPEGADPLPLFGYAAVALKGEQIYVAAVPTDQPQHWDPLYYNTEDLPRLIARKRKKLAENRLLEHLAHCALQYQCFTAQNIFYERWEGGIPLSPVCNAHCLGCISLQESECCPSPQSRIKFQPAAWEVAEIAVPHLNQAPEAIISFGQGCEGDPSLSPELPKAISLIRSQTSRGTINMNSNAGFTAGIKAACQAGLDSIRVSIISARPQIYQKYYRASYHLQDVCNSIAYASQSGVFVSLNLLFFPGFSDREEELAAMLELIDQYKVNMVQVRNLNIDPDWFLSQMPPAEKDILGVPEYLAELRKVPGLQVGSFSHAVN